MAMSAHRGAQVPAISIRSLVRAPDSVVVARFDAPREEQRIVTFIDLIGSTAIAERLGSVRFHGLLSDVFTDCRGGGRFRRRGPRYVGDALIATWPLGTREQNTRSIRRNFRSLRGAGIGGPDFERRHGEVPRAFRASLHCGPLVAAEIGAFKGEIALVGDAMNTAARIEQACRTTGHRILISRSLLMRVSMPVGAAAKSIGTRLLPGKSQPVELFALESGAGLPKSRYCPLRACA